MSSRIAAVLLLVFGALIPCAQAGHPGKSSVVFSVTADVGPGNEVFVTGNHPDLSSSGMISPGVKLTWSAGNIWQGNVAIESGATIQYQFVRRAGDNVGYCSGTTSTLSFTQPLTIPAADGPPYAAKRIRYTSNWNSAFLLYRDLSTGGSWTESAMTIAGPGRVAGEKIFEARGISAPGNQVEFVFHNELSQYDNAPAPPSNTAQGAAPAVPVPYQGLTAPYNYRTALDIFQVQDGQVYNYRPPASPSVPRTETRLVGSTVTGIPARNIRIWLPRGYDNNTWKRYPVVYFHDGQNVFFPGGTFGTWDADRIASYEMSQGRMREAILVAVDNVNSDGSDRMKEYLPPNDSLSGNAGTGDKYSQYLRNNVLPTLDYNYRTLNQPGQTARPLDNVLAGSSLGGLITAYIGRESSAVFGRLGIFSPALWAAPNYVSGSLLTAPKLPLQIYMDIGSAENSTSQSDSGIYWNDTIKFYNACLRNGYAVNTELLLRPECGANHNEQAWSRRLPGFFSFALSVWNDPQWLAAALETPPVQLQSVSADGTQATVKFLAPREVPVVIETSTNFVNWANWATPAATSSLWESTTLSGTQITGDHRFWRTRIAAP